MDENKVSFGLKNVHYATFTENAGAISYDTPIPIPGAVEIELEPRGDLIEFYADDMLYYSAANNQGYDGTLNIANIPESFSLDCLGEVKNEVDGVITEKSTSKSKPFALLFEFDGDIKATRHVLYNCSSNRPKIGSSSKTDTAEPNENELTFVASPRATDYAVKTKTSSTTTQVVYDNWYTSVYGETIDITPPTVTVSPLDATTGVLTTSDIIWTFSEAIRESDVIGANFFVMDNTGAEIVGELTISTDKKVVTFNPTSNLAALTSYTAVITKNVKDLRGNSLAANSVTNFTTA